MRRKRWDLNGGFGVIVGGALGAVLIAAIGVSAHTTNLPVLTLIGVQQSHSSDEASGARTEPSEKPEAKPTAEPTEKPEPTPTATPSTEPTEPPDENEGSDD